ncbi:hypothetical protein JKP88DRAFT_264462 [Tribonema minus]|uniref:Uncharacterized protein n=1 Tax=Tribonema minus TaxID=303371 RepID=A0A835YQN0_9STRA|nr:hypothetical protein JKP88DRAFT_264462 [Tribonema minus]
MDTVMNTCLPMAVGDVDSVDQVLNITRRMSTASMGSLPPPPQQQQQLLQGAYHAATAEAHPSRLGFGGGGSGAAYDGGSGRLGLAGGSAPQQQHAAPSGMQLPPPLAVETLLMRARSRGSIGGGFSRGGSRAGTPRGGAFAGGGAGGDDAPPTNVLLSLHDAGWALALDFLDLHDVVAVTRTARELAHRAHETMTVLSLHGVRGGWVGPHALAAITRFRRVRTLHWCVGALPAPPPPETPLVEPEDGEETYESRRHRCQSSSGGAARDDESRRHCPAQQWYGEPLMVWTFLLARLPLLDVTITPGVANDEDALGELWERVLPACAPQLRRFALAFEGYQPPPPQGDQLRRFALAFEGYQPLPPPSDQPPPIDYPPINVKRFALMLATRNPFPALRELHLELSSMSISEQRSLVRGITQGGLLARLECLTMGGGTSVYARPKIGAGQELATALREHGAPNLRLLWLQRFDVWDDFPGVFSALSDRTLCPALKELYIDATLDHDDTLALAAALPLVPTCLKTLGMMVMALRERDHLGYFKRVSPVPAVTAIATALLEAQRPQLGCVDLCLHFEPPQEGETDEWYSDELPPPPPADKSPVDASIPLLRAFQAGAVPNMRHLQLPNCRLSKAAGAVPNMRHLQLPNCRLSKAAGAVSNMRHLQLPNCRLSKAALNEMLDALRAMPKVQTLDISGNALEPQHLVWLAQELPKAAPLCYEVMINAMWRRLSKVAPLCYEVMVEECAVSRLRAPAVSSDACDRADARRSAQLISQCARAQMQAQRVCKGRGQGNARCELRVAHLRRACEMLRLRATCDVS